MRERLRRHLPIVLTALLTASLTAAAPSIAETVNKALFAENADKVDGIHAKQYTTNAGQRENKLVATNGQGRLPNNIIKKAPDSSKLNGLKGARYLDHDARTIVVDKTGKGDFKTIQAAVNAAQPNPGTPYRILVLRGTYQEKVELEPNVHLEGAGVVRPLITCQCGTESNSATFSGTLALRGGSTVMNIDVENTGGFDYSHAIDVSGTNNELIKVDAMAHGGAVDNIGIYARYEGGVFPGSSSKSRPQGFPMVGQLKLDEVFAEASSTSGAQESKAVEAQSVSLTAEDSSFFATGAGSGINPLNRGIDVIQGNHDFRRIDVDVSGPDPARSSGIAQQSSSMTLRDSTIDAVGSSHSYFGIFNSNADMKISNVSIRSAGATSGVNYGVFNTANPGPASGRTNKIERSSIVAEGSTIVNGVAGYTNWIGASQLDGAAVSPGSSTIKCAGVYDEDFDFFASTCP